MAVLSLAEHTLFVLEKLSLRHGESVLSKEVAEERATLLKAARSYRSLKDEASTLELQPISLFRLLRSHAVARLAHFGPWYYAL